MDEIKHILLNDLGEGLNEAKLVEWKIMPGDHIDYDQIIAHVETAKAIIELPSPYAGTVKKLNHQPGDAIPVGATIADIHIKAPESASSEMIKPLVGKVHHETTILEDESLLRHAPTIMETSLDQYQNQSMAHNIQQSNEVIAATLYDDMSVAEFNLNDNITAQCIDRLIKVLQTFPKFNAHFCGNSMQLTQQKHIHLGIAFNENDQLKVPVVEQIEQYDLAGLNELIRSLKADGLKSQYLSTKHVKPSFTLSNIGSLGGRYGTPILLPPAVGILAIGKITKTPIVRNDNIVIEPLAPLSLTFDHRALTGAEACQFLSTLCQH